MMEKNQSTLQLTADTVPLARNKVLKNALVFSEIFPCLALCIIMNYETCLSILCEYRQSHAV